MEIKLKNLTVTSSESNNKSIQLKGSWNLSQLLQSNGYVIKKDSCLLKPGIFIWINDVDYRSIGGLSYQLKSNDNVTVLSVLNI